MEKEVGGERVADYKGSGLIVDCKVGVARILKEAASQGSKAEKN